MLKNWIKFVDNRNKRVFSNASVGLVAQIFSVISQFSIIRISIDHLGPNDFGIWMAINSVVAILMVSDFGLAGAMLRLTAHRKGGDGQYDVYALGLAAVRFLAVIGVTILAVALAISASPSFYSQMGIDRYQESEDALNAFRALMAFFAVNLVAQVSIPLRLGMQKGHVNGLFQILGHLCNLIFVVVATQFGANLAWLASAAVAGSTTSNLLNLITLLLSSKEINKNSSIPVSLKSVMNSSAPFFLLGLIGVLSYNVDNLVIARYLSLSDVSQNSIAQRIFNIPVFFVSLFYIGLWAGYSDAELSDDYNWIKKTYITSILIAVPLTAAAGIGLYVFFDFAALFITNGKVHFNNYLLLCFCLWLPVTVMSGATASLMNGLHMLRPQVLVSLLALAINLSLSIFLVNRIGVSGPIFATFLSMIITQPILVWICLTELNKRNSKVYSKMKNGLVI
jgi:O-antigen/teichoic acid export membrane protein